MEIFLVRGGELIPPGCGGTSALSRGATLAVRWLHEPQSINHHQVGLGFHTLRGGIDPVNLRFRPRVIGAVETWTDFEPAMGNYTPRGALWLSTIPSRSAIGQRDWGFHTLPRVSTREITAFVPRLLEL